MGSRVANNPVKLPSGVEAKLTGQQLSIKGKQGELQFQLHPKIKFSQSENTLQVTPDNNEKEVIALAGTARALINNMVIGVSEGFQRKLILVGVGYRAAVQGNVINLTLGFSHPAKYELPEGVSAETPSATEVILKGVDKRLVNQVAAKIRAMRPPEPYKGKGIRYDDETIMLKEGKKK